MTIIFEPKYAYDLTIDEAAWLFGMNNLRRSPLELSSRGMTDQFVERIERFDPELHAFVEVMTDRARADADAADARRYADERLTPLDGVSIAVKDIFDVKGVPTRCGSAARQDAPPAEEDAEAVRRLREAGAVIIGKTTTQEFAAGVVSAPCRNPWDITRIPGGSSGGSAVAVAAGLATAALGSDTGGSVRIPAAVTGTVGLKPTYGAVSKRGVFPLAPSLDTVGPITRTVRDAALIFDAILGQDPLDPDSSSVKQAWASDIENDVDLKGYRIGVPRPFFFDRLQAPVGVVTEGVIELAKELGAEVVETPWADAALARSSAMIINRVETVDVHIDAIRKHPELYGQELRERVQATALFPRARYQRALQVREHVKQSMANLFTEHRLNALLTPTVPGVAVPAEDLFVRYEDGSAEPVTLSYTRLTQPFNATGQPALSIPVGIDADLLPISVQLVGKPFGEAELCRIGSALDKAIDWRGEMSPLRMPRYGSSDVAEF